MDKQAAIRFKDSKQPVWFWGVWSDLPVKARIIEIKKENGVEYANVDCIRDEDSYMIGFQRVVFEKLFPSREALLQSVAQEERARIAEIKAEIRTMEDCLIYLYDHHIARGRSTRTGQHVKPSRSWPGNGGGWNLDSLGHPASWAGCPCCPNTPIICERGKCMKYLVVESEDETFYNLEEVSSISYELAQNVLNGSELAEKDLKPLETVVVILLESGSREVFSTVGLNMYFD